MTSASLMVLWPAAAEAASYARGRSGFSLGLHLDLGEWAYRDDDWATVYERAKLDDATALRAELENQLTEFERLAGGPPTHLDSHHHVHHADEVAPVFVELADELGVPLRHYSAAVRYCGDFYGQSGKGDPFPEGITPDGLLAILGSLAPGTTELGCHPGYGDDVDTMYREERELEVRTLCDPRVRTELAGEGIELRTFADVR